MNKNYTFISNSRYVKSIDTKEALEDTERLNLVANNILKIQIIL